MIDQPDHGKATGQVFLFFLFGGKTPSRFAKLDIPAPAGQGGGPFRPPGFLEFKQRVWVYFCHDDLFSRGPAGRFGERLE